MLVWYDATIYGRTAALTSFSRIQLSFLALGKPIR
jgi:hypothetical protein